MCKLIASAEMVVPSEGFSDPASQRSLVESVGVFPDRILLM